MGTAYAAFNLLLTDGQDALVIRHDPCLDGEAKPGDVFELLEGAHVLTNLHELDEVLVPLEGLPNPEEPLESTLLRLEILARDEHTVLPGDHQIALVLGDLATCRPGNRVVIYGKPRRSSQDAYKPVEALALGDAVPVGEAAEVIERFPT